MDDKVEDGARPEDIPVTKISRHPLFGKIDEGYDIAVLQLERRVNFSGNKILDLLELRM